MLKFFRIPFALSGDKTAVPDASQPSGSVSYTDGFGPDYELDPGVDPAAKDVPRDESNQLYFDITTAIAELQAFGTPDFITSALNGGAPFSYAKYARVKWTDNKVYESTVAANVTDPTTSPASWRQLSDSVDYLSIATTAFQASVVDGEAVYWDGVQFDEAVADGTNKQNFIGFADVTNGRVFAYGQYAGQLAGLVANTEYFLSPVTPGALTTVRPENNAVSVGVAKTATSMHVNPTPAIPLPSETVAGLGRNATQAETDAGSAGSFSVTPAKLRNGFAASIGTTGYIKLPSWLGGLIIQWGQPTAASASPVVTFPIAFPTAIVAALPYDINTAVNVANPTTGLLTNPAQITFYFSSNPGLFGWIAIGY
jgi:hypothetical protein